MLIFTSPALTILAVLVGIVVYTRLSRVLGLVIVAIAVFNGIYSTNYPFDRILTGGLFVLAVLVALLMLMFSLLVAYSRLVESVGRTAAVAAVIIALLNSFWAAPGMMWSFVGGDAMQARITQMQADAEDAIAQITGAQSEEHKKMWDAINRNTADIKALSNRVGLIDGRLIQVEDWVGAMEVTHNGISSTKLHLDPKAKASAIKNMRDDLTAAGWQPDQFNVFNVDWNIHKVERGSGAFTTYTLTSEAEVWEFLKGDTATAKAAVRFMEENGAPLDKIKGFIPFQTLEPIDLHHNTFFDGTNARVLDKARSHSAGFVMWIPYDENGELYWGAAIAADCGNAGTSAVPSPKSSTQVDREKAKVCTWGYYKGRTPVNGSCDKPETPDPTTDPTPDPTPTPEPTDEPMTEPDPTPTPEPKACPPWNDGHVPTRNEDGTCPKGPDGPDKPPAASSPAPAPSEPPEVTPAPEPEPAPPSVEPGDPAPAVPAPGSSPAPASPAPPTTVDPDPTAPAEGPVTPGR